jgi:hypothetical protein
MIIVWMMTRSSKPIMAYQPLGGGDDHYIPVGGDGASSSGLMNPRASPKEMEHLITDVSNRDIDYAYSSVASSTEGISAAESARRMAIFGPNRLVV